MTEKAERDDTVGIAFDLGTTTIAASVVQLCDGTELASRSIHNPQSHYGQDVLSRVMAIVEDISRLEEMQHSVLAALNEVSASLDVTPSRVKRISVAGNTVMEHILLGVSPASLSKVPYRPVFKEAQIVDAGALGLNAAADAKLYVFPIIGGFVGGDAVAASLSLGIKPGDGCVLAVDIGTNSEIMLASKKNIYFASAAAGPAFEGGGIGCGMVASDGAIENVSIEDDELSLKVIGDVKPRGICGSGLLKAVSVLADAGVIDQNGRIRSLSEIETPISNVVREGKDKNAIILYRDASTEITITQDDVRSLQVAKAAIRAGISVVLKKAAVEPEEVATVFVAGAFGSNIDYDALVNVGVLHSCFEGSIESVGDAALKGAVAALYEDGREKAEEVARQAKYVSLSGAKQFEEEFIANMDIKKTTKEGR